MTTISRRRLLDLFGKSVAVGAAVTLPAMAARAPEVQQVHRDPGAERFVAAYLAMTPGDRVIALEMMENVAKARGHGRTAA